MSEPDTAYVSRFKLQGDPTGPLAGTTFAIKDAYDIAGHVTGAGNPDWARTHAPATAHAPILERLLASGATCVGKTLTDEIAYSLMGINAHYGTPRNPAAPDRVPGGSSSGSASTVAAGAVDFAVGGDTGGSVRLPASFCGIIGIRTTHGALPLERIVPLAPSFDTVGWFARDPGLMIRVGSALGLGDGPTAGKLTRLLMPRDLWEIASADVQDELKPARAHVADALGRADENPVSQSELDSWRETFRVLQAGEVWAAHGAWVTETRPTFAPDVAARFEMASRITKEEIAAAQAHRDEITRTLHERLASDGVIAIPTSPAEPPLLNADASDLEAFRARALCMLCPAGLGGLPQVSIPAATAVGAPVGLSLIGPRGSDMALLEMAEQLLAAIKGDR